MVETLPSPKMAGIDLLNNLEKISSSIPNRVLKVEGYIIKDDNKIKGYILWAENYVQHSPYLFVYYDLATAYESLGNREKAWDIYRYAKHLYPGAKWRDEN